MKRWLIASCLLVACARLHAAGWQPADGYTQIPLWPAAAPGAKPMPGPEKTWEGDENVPGTSRKSVGVTNVSVPTMTVYAPRGANTGAAVVVFPGGGFEMLAIDLEGTEICDWLTSNGITCVLLKYRVPSEPYDWHCDCRPDNLVTSTQSLDDAAVVIGGVLAIHGVENAVRARLHG